MLRKSVLVIALLIASHRAIGQANPVPPRVPEITASGRGEVAITPDRATVLVSLESRAPSAAAAAADNSQKMKLVLQALRGAGLAQADITTSIYAVGQDPRSLRVPPGTGIPNFPVEFLARNTVRASVRRADDVGKVIDAALGAGATSIASVQFSSATTEEARGNALAMGVAQAQRDANILAKASGGTLGRLLSMSSSGSPVMAAGFAGDVYYSVDREMAASTAFPTMINARDLTVAISVFGRWEFIPAPGR
jgi:uncharacterized protein YggE